MQVPMMKLLDEKELTNIASLMTTREISKGTKIITQGDSGDEMYVIIEGTAVCLVNFNEVARLSTGDFFGELAL